MAAPHGRVEHLGRDDIERVVVPPGRLAEGSPHRDADGLGRETDESHPVVDGATDRCRELVENSFAMLTALSPYVGYEAASDLAREAIETGRTIRQAALDIGLFTAEQIDAILSTTEMTKPGIAGEDVISADD